MIGNKRYFLVFAFILFFNSISCRRSTSPESQPDLSEGFIKGADISWLTEMEASGRRFYSTDGSEQDLFHILKNMGLNTIRLRVWVNPASGWNNKEDVLEKALRAWNAGMRIMINFHYSNTWADPRHQSKPADWSGQDINALVLSVSIHTTDVLASLKTAGITPEWVQIGNETNDGMLWPEGKASINMANFARLISVGYDAAKSVFPTIKVIVHVSNGWDNSLFRWLFDGLKNNGAKWDVTGMSLYPSPSNWPSLNTQCLANMNDMVLRYGKEVVVVEVGMSWVQASACKDFITDLINNVKSVNNNKGLGILYWEPEAYNNWQGYTLGAFDNSGKPTIALSAFK